MELQRPSRGIVIECMLYMHSLMSDGSSRVVREWSFVIELPDGQIEVLWPVNRFEMALGLHKNSDT